MLYTLQPDRTTLHGPFSRERAPCLTVDSGDTVRLSTLDAGWGLEAPHADGSPRRQFEPRSPEDDKGHCLVGPIAVRGAQPGMALEVHIDDLRPGVYGWTAAGGWSYPVNDRLGVSGGPETTLIWSLDADQMIGRDQFGHQVTLKPHLGVIGMPADEAGYQPTPPPRFCGGNMDCKEFGAGTSVFLPIAVEGGLLSVGDGHALMGDGELSCTGIECPMEFVQLTLTLHPDLKFKTPRAKTSTAWLTLGFNEDLDEAAMIAAEAMLDLIETQYQIPERQALALASLVVDFRVTQLVNGVHGVHAVLPHGAIR
jgi:acetamidase/formamidase